MALPRKLKQMNVFLDGESYLGVAEEYTPAKLTKKFEKYRGAGMLGAVNINMGYDDGALDTEATFGGYVADLVRKSNTGRHDGVVLRFAGAMQRDDTGEVAALEITTRGRIEEIDRGTYKVGDNSQTKFKLVNTYYREVIDGVTVCEIDLVNMIDTANGEDMLADIRRAIGI